MKRNKSNINGVRNEYRQLEGRGQFFQVCQCSKCSTTIEFSTKYSPMPRVAVFNKMRDNGWLPYNDGRHVCPQCRSKAVKKSDSAVKTINSTPDPKPEPKPKSRGGALAPRPVTIRGVDYPNLRVAADAFGIPKSTLHYLIQNDKFEDYMKRRVKKTDEIKQMLKNEEVNTVTQEQKIALPSSLPPASTVASPREMSREHRRRIWRYLDEVYDVPNGRYTGANTDHVVAEELKVPRAWVAEVRDEVFGPEGGNDEMEKLRTDIASLSDKLAKAIETCLNAAADAETIQGEVKRLESRFQNLRDLVGPHAHRVK